MMSLRPLYRTLTIVLCADADADAATAAEGARNESLMSFLWNAQRASSMANA